MTQNTRFGSGLSDAQMRLARRIADADIASISQVVKAMTRHNDEKIAEWKEALRRYDAEHGRAW